MRDKKRKAPKGRISEIVAVDFGHAGMKLVRAQQGKDGPQIVQAAVLPPLDPATAPEEGGHAERKLNLPRAWHSNYVSLLFPGSDAIVRHMTLPGALGNPLEAKVREHMGLEKSYRLACIPLRAAQKKSETRLLAVALPEDQAARVLNLVPSGPPAPKALEISSLAALHAFARYGPLKDRPDDTIGFVEAGARVALIALFHQTALVLVRKFNLGGEVLIDRICKQMSVGRDIAEGILREASFDISQTVADVMDPFLRQVSISKDFVERREGGRLHSLYVSGGMSLSHFWKERLCSIAGLEVNVWNPLASVPAADGAWQTEIAGQEPRFAAAVGGALGAWDE